MAKSDIRLLFCLLLNIVIGILIFIIDKRVITNNETLLLIFLFLIGILLGGFITLFLNNGQLFYNILLVVYTCACILGTFFSLRNYDTNDNEITKMKNGAIIFGVITLCIMVPMAINNVMQ
jgi:hypothetical protein